MLYILLSWVYILAVSIAIGLVINRLLKIFSTDTAIVTLLGFFSITLFAGFWAIFFAVNWQFHLVLLIMSAISMKLNGLAIQSFIENLKKELKALSTFLKAFLVLITVLILAQCASPPFLIDNESYYIQTINWLNDYGFVKGLVNLHLFLGQTSGWHILQSAFNFSFLYENFNDLSGLCLLLGNYYAIIKLNNYISKTESSKINLIVGLFPIFNVFLFQFISAPSPDLAVYVIGVIVFHQFVIGYPKFNKKSFLILCTLSLFLVLIKLSAVFFCVFPIVLFAKHYSETKKSTGLLFLIGSLTLLLIIIKNIIITGNAIYPLASVESLRLDWHLPKAVETYFNNFGLAEGYNLTPEAFKNVSVLELLKHWLLQSNLNGLFNGLMILLLFVSPWLIVKSKLKQPLVMIYIVAVINLAFLLTISPQYRFFLPFIIILLLFIFAKVIQRTKVIHTIFGLVIAVTVVSVFMSINVFKLTANQLHQNTMAFKLNYMITPHSNSRYTTDYEAIHLENTTLNTPTHIDFFWATGNTPIPAVNKQQLEYFETYFKVIPQQLGEDVNEGYYSKELD